MTIRRTLEIAAFCAALLLVALLFRSWLDAHDDQLRLAATLASQQQAIDAADARERDRNASLKDALAQIDALKRSAQNQTPAQLARALQDALQLPQPITIRADATPAASPPDSSASPNATVGARHDVPERPNVTTAPLTSNDHSSDVRAAAPGPDSANAASHPLDVRTAGVSSAPLAPSSSQQQHAQNSQQGTTPRVKFLFDAHFHRPPRTPPDATPASSPPSQPGVLPGAASHSANTPSSSGVQSRDAASSPDTLRSAAAESSRDDAQSSAPQSSAEIPAADLAPLYDYIQDCRACQLQLAAAKQNADDDAAKIAALTRERDAALRAAKGGTLWLRLKRNAHWLAIGAAIGVATSAATLCTTNHCR